jgi:hypothetical protein
VFKILTEKKNIPLYVTTDAWKEQQASDLEAAKNPKKKKKEEKLAPSILSARDFGFSCVVSACIKYISVVLHEKSILNSVVIYKVIITHLPGKCNPFTNISRAPATFSPPARYYIQKHPGKEHV